jgi:hypothetical protein
VVPGSFDVRTRSPPTMRLMSVLLPTLGRPTTAMRIPEPRSSSRIVGPQAGAPSQPASGPPPLAMRSGDDIWDRTPARGDPRLPARVSALRLIGHQQGGLASLCR